MSRVRVGVDLDGVCYDFNAALEGWIKQEGREVRDRYTFGPSTRWEFYEDWGMDVATFITYCNRGVNAGYIFKVGDVINDAVAQLQRLRNAGCEIVLITDRSFGANGMSEKNTRGWLANSRLPFDEIYFTADKAAVSVDFMIDDKPANYVAMSGAGVFTYLLDAGWNQDFIEHALAPVWRVNSLAEYVDIVLTSISDKRKATFNGDVSKLQGPPVVGTVDFIEGLEKAKKQADEIRVTSATGGMKGTKLARFDLIPSYPNWLLAELYGKGSLKYDDRNWEKGYDWSKSVAAIGRHFELFKAGQWLDAHEPGCPVDCAQHTEMPHLICVAWHCFALTEWSKTHPEFNDLPEITAMRLHMNW